MGIGPWNDFRGQRAERHINLQKIVDLHVGDGRDSRVGDEYKAARHGYRSGRKIDKPAPFACDKIELLACEKGKDIHGGLTGAKKAA